VTEVAFDTKAILGNHRKFVELSDQAFLTWQRCIAWSVEHRTDGRIPAAVLRRLAHVRRWKRPAQELVDAELMEATAAGYVIHDFADHQVTTDQLEQRRRRERERKRRRRQMSHPDTDADAERTPPKNPPGGGDGDV